MHGAGPNRWCRALRRSIADSARRSHRCSHLAVSPNLHLLRMCSTRRRTFAPTDYAAPTHDTEVSDHIETPEMDPALFVPIAVPFDEPRVEAEIPEWAEQPGEVAPSDVDTDEPEWNGGYAHDSGDGAGSDVDVDLDVVPEEVELDRLIDELESAKIVPAEDPGSVPEPDLSVDIDDVVSETLARIYATQSQYSEAARVYDRLALENPDRADEYETKASEMRARSR